MTGRLRVGISTCPNDTFAFHGLLTGALRDRGLELEFLLRDVQELNERLAAGDLDVLKVSCSSAFAAAADVALLDAGAALGHGVGPVLVGVPGGPREGADCRVLAPGAGTTADLLLGLFRPDLPAARQVVFSEILPALQRGEADLGACIHEGRFTYASLGLELALDLGAAWEEATGLPLPLGGVVVRKRVGRDGARRLAGLLRRSIDTARAEPDAALETMRAHAQEHDDDALWKHVELYVNDETRRLSPVGRAALATLEGRARRAGRVPHSAPALEVWGAP